jgi:N-methylhydantoinase B
VAREVYRVALDSRGQLDQHGTQMLRKLPAAASTGSTASVAWDGQ